MPIQFSRHVSSIPPYLRSYPQIDDAKEMDKKKVNSFGVVRQRKDGCALKKQPQNSDPQRKLDLDETMTTRGQWVRRECPFLGPIH